ncbi:2OG-Fe(II) oxygenase [Streptomyces sp. NPDC058662]|uniref:HalD/BesD family halogenase n=1 Tax=Streptomyces sp. NPDC058662 TaxID=3346583 RepID=UPI00364A508C
MFNVPKDAGQAPARLAESGYVPLADFLTAEGLTLLWQEAARLGDIALRRDFSMACMDDSPRRMTTLGGQMIAEKSQMIPRLYKGEELISLLGRLTGQDVAPVPDPMERHVLNILHQHGDTHGGHTDDYPYALVLFLEAPSDPEDGGLLEFTPHTPDLAALGTPAAVTAHHQAGDAYLLRSDTTAHRVTPLTRPGARRTVLNFAYTLPNHTVHKTNSADQLYR